MEENNISFWRQASLKIKTACLSFLLAKIIFVPAGLLIFIPLNTGSLPIMRIAFFSLYCFLVVATLVLCCWELLGNKKEEIPSEEKVTEWMKYYAENNSFTNK
jgi:hypothetical protein